MKFLVFAFAVFAAARAASLASDYLPPVLDNNLPTPEYLPPDTPAAAPTDEVAPLTADGYRYKVVRRLRLRHRRDVSELPAASEYLPPATGEEESVVAIDVPVTAAAPAVAEQTQLAADGYRYKVVRRLRLRHRRDVSELPGNEYLPPTEAPQDVVVVEAATEVSAEDAAAEEKTVLADDGYRYKVVRRVKYRHRRDVNELPENEYLPPAEEAQDQDSAVAEAPVEPAAAEEKTDLADDGYRYKVVRRLKYRHRRDVNELPDNEYLPPAEEAQDPDSVLVEAPAEPAAAEKETVLADDGYRYKVVRRLKYRHRRDVSELPENEYLPPTEETQWKHTVVVEAPTEPAVAEEKTALADDGYRYKVVRRLKYRQRRDVSELPTTEYLPPAEESQDAVAAAAPVDVPTLLADDGYRYKAVRRLKYRRH